MVKGVQARRLLPALVVALALPLAAGARSAAPLPQAPGCPLFPATSHWNQRVDQLPRAKNSDAIVRAIGAGDHMHADFGSGLWEGGAIGIPITVVGKAQPKVRVSFEYAR